MPVRREVGRRVRRGRWRLNLALVLLAFMVAGCGSSASKQSTSAVQAPAATIAAQTAASPIASASPPGVAATATQTANTGPSASASPAAAVPAKIVEPDGNNPNSWGFAPAILHVQVGNRVTWANTGLATHTVTADDGSSFDSGSIQCGDSFSFTFTRAGTYTNHCSFHPWLKGTVVVGG